jgi:hypothetical protein
MAKDKPRREARKPKKSSAKSAVPAPATRPAPAPRS